MHNLFIDYNSDISSSLWKTNPSLTGNLKYVIYEDGQIYLTSLTNSSYILLEELISYSNSFELSLFLKKHLSKNNDNLYKVEENVKYDYGVNDYSGEYFAPFYIARKEDIPTHFMLLSCADSILIQNYFKEDNVNLQDIYKKSQVIAEYDLSKYRNILNSSNYSKPFSKDSKFDIYWLSGHNWDIGYNSMKISKYGSSISQTEAMEWFKEKKMISDRIYNFSFKIPKNYINGSRNLIGLYVKKNKVFSFLPSLSFIETELSNVINVKNQILDSENRIVLEKQTGVELKFDNDTIVGNVSKIQTEDFSFLTCSNVKNESHLFDTVKIYESAEKNISSVKFWQTTKNISSFYSFGENANTIFAKRNRIEDPYLILNFSRKNTKCIFLNTDYISIKSSYLNGTSQYEWRIIANDNDCCDISSVSYNKGNKYILQTEHFNITQVEYGFDRVTLEFPMMGIKFEEGADISFATKNSNGFILAKISKIENDFANDKTILTIYVNGRNLVNFRINQQIIDVQYTEPSYYYTFFKFNNDEKYCKEQIVKAFKTFKQNQFIIRLLNDNIVFSSVKGSITGLELSWNFTESFNNSTQVKIFTSDDEEYKVFNGDGKILEKRARGSILFFGEKNLYKNPIIIHSDDISKIKRNTIIDTKLGYSSFMFFNNVLVTLPYINLEENKIYDDYVYVFLTDETDNISQSQNKLEISLFEQHRVPIFINAVQKFNT